MSVDVAYGKLSKTSSTTVPFIFTHYGRSLSEDETPEEAGIEDHDVVVAIEMMDITGDVSEDKFLEVEPEMNVRPTA